MRMTESGSAAGMTWSRNTFICLVLKTLRKWTAWKTRRRLSMILKRTLSTNKVVVRDKEILWADINTITNRLGL